MNKLPIPLVSLRKCPKIKEFNLKMMPLLAGYKKVNLRAVTISVLLCDARLSLGQKRAKYSKARSRKSTTPNTQSQECANKRNILSLFRVFLFLMYDFHTAKCTLLTQQLSKFLFTFYLCMHHPDQDIGIYVTPENSLHLFPVQYLPQRHPLHWLESSSIIFICL